MDDLERTYTCIVLLSHRFEASAAYVLEVAEQGLDHLLDVVGTLVHVLIRQKAAPFKHNRLVHLLVDLVLLQFFLDLVELHLDVIGLSLARRQFLVDVCLQRVVSCLYFMFSLFIPRMIATSILL